MNYFKDGVPVKRLIEIVFSLLLGILSYVIINYVYIFVREIIVIDKKWFYLISIFISVIIAIIFYLFLTNKILNYALKKIHIIEEKIAKMSLKEIIISVTGILVGLIVANLIGLAVRQYEYIGTIVVVILNIILGYLGYKVAQIKKEEIVFFKFSQNPNKEAVTISGKAKILDTSVIIDGRVLDILKTGFIEGKIVIPDFVLVELRHIADSEDALKRSKGRRGLDILNEIQSQLKLEVEILEWDNKDIDEVDAKLLKMAKKMDGYVVTNDYNLHKVADFQGVQVLNINELSNAVKPILLPGEEMRVTIVKEGKEESQGIAYLNDGTMIVVENGKKCIGQTLDIIVTSALQTSAGRMIFAKVKE